nr:hypothetical protein [Sinorhizobium meliloti]
MYWQRRKLMAPSLFLLSANAVIMLPQAPRTVGPGPYNLITRQSLERIQYGPRDSGASVLVGIGEFGAELSKDCIDSNFLLKHPALSDLSQHPLSYSSGRHLLPASFTTSSDAGWKKAVLLVAPANHDV